MRSTTGHSPTLLQCRWRRLLATGPLVGVLALTASGLAQADVITSVNGALLNIVRSTSASLIDGPPEVAREIAMIDGSMFNAVSAASSNSYAAVAFAGADHLGRLGRRRGPAGGNHRDGQPVRKPQLAVSTI